MKAFCSCKHVLDGCDGVVANKALLVALSTLSGFSSIVLQSQKCCGKQQPDLMRKSHCFTRSLFVMHSYDVLNLFCSVFLLVFFRSFVWFWIPGQ